ncbi:hypothetical protein Dimus_003022 [Dionaea muscipula]
MNGMQKMLSVDGTAMTLMGIVYELNFHMKGVDTHHQIDLAVAVIVVEFPGVPSIVAHMRRAGDVCFSDVYRDRGCEVHEISLWIISISYLLERCNLCYIGLEKVKHYLPSLMRRGGPIAKSGQELNLALNAACE